MIIKQIFLYQYSSVMQYINIYNKKNSTLYISPFILVHLILKKKKIKKIISYYNWIRTEDCSIFFMTKVCPFENLTMIYAIQWLFLIFEATMAIWKDTHISRHSNLISSDKLESGNSLWLFHTIVSNKTDGCFECFTSQTNKIIYHRLLVFICQSNRDAS